MLFGSVLDHRHLKTQQYAAVDRPKRWRALGSLRGLRPLRRQLSFGVMPLWG